METTTPQPGAEPLTGSIRRLGDIPDTRDPREEDVDTMADSPKGATAETVQSATDWFLSDEHIAPDLFVHTIEVDVGPPQEARWITWKVRPLDTDEMTAIRRQAQQAPNRQGRRLGARGEEDQAQFMRLVVVTASIDPDFHAVAQAKRIADPTLVLKERLAHKPGIVDLIAGEIITLSGYDDDAMRDEGAGTASIKKQIRAAGN